MVIIVYKINQFVCVLRIFSHKQKLKPKKGVKRKKNMYCIVLYNNNISE